MVSGKFKPRIPNSELSLSPNKRWAAGTVLLALGLIAVAAVLWRFDPAQHRFYPRCQLYTMTGLQCPGCGGLRALHELLRGRVVEALKLNPLFVLGVPAAVVLAGVWFVRKRRNPAARVALPTGWIWAGVAVFIAFGVVRNLPGMSLAWFGP
jgi:hypothetical protein